MDNYINSVSQMYSQTSSDFDAIENIKRGKSEKEQLKRVTNEFEAIFTAKMLNVLDKTVDKTGSMFQDGKYLDNLKSFMYNDIARTISSNPNTSLGIAKQMYQQLEKTVKG